MADTKNRVRNLVVKTLQVLNNVVVNGTVTATSFIGNVTGNVTGTITGNVTGNVTGAARNAQVVVTANGAIAVPTVNTTYHITKAGVAAMTLVDPTAVTHDGIQLTFVSETANAHTLSNAAGSGFNNGGAASDVGTFGGAVGDGLTIEARNGKWWVLPGTNQNVTLG